MKKEKQYLLIRIKKAKFELELYKTMIKKEKLELEMLNKLLKNLK